MFFLEGFIPLIVEDKEQIIGSVLSWKYATKRDLGMPSTSAP